MPTFIDREEVGRMLADGAQLVDVLPSNAYEREHIPGAISIPLKRIDADGPRQLDQSRPVIVYCGSFT